MSITTASQGNAGLITSDLNTPTILGSQENPHKVELIVAEDGTQTVGNYKLGKFG